MKSIYITLFFLFGVSIYSQENKQVQQAEDQTLTVKQAKEFEATMMKEAQANAEKKPSQTALVSEQGLDSKKLEQKPQTASGQSGTLLPNTASLEDIKRSIPNRKVPRSATVKPISGNTTGLRSPATLAEIRKTIPKN
ncbi:MAG: hypothetical protein LBE92_00990 [Chryseobacterium sp.]|jgi:hypothetical protein|uniref:hypothetical protein n=1 Tax=Chryseobacterium sp. TaxID=1871047 RepID=UPI00281E197A|nr:hypothetical protein [Chryseobacterium sp.]MDR2234675.1 hypothetical protein [Chryseobacterium sp.]